MSRLDTSSTSSDAMSTGQVTLLDLASKQGTAWLRHSWKTRLLLNYKGLDYKTEWVEYPGIKPKVEPHLPANETGAAYTIPTVILPDGTWMMDSRKIASALETLYPTPSLHLDSPYLTRVEQTLAKVERSVVPLCYTRIPVNVLNDASVEYWYATRRERLGMTVQEYEDKHGGGEAAYAGAEPYLKELTDMLKETDGPFFMGEEVSYADFTWVALLRFFERVDGVIFGELLKRTGDQAVHERLLHACAEWLERDDH